MSSIPEPLRLLIYVVIAIIIIVFVVWLVRELFWTHFFIASSTMSQEIPTINYFSLLF